MGRDPLLGRVHLLLGRQNLCFSTIIVIYGSPNCVFLSFVVRQQPNVENHCSRARRTLPNKLNFTVEKINQNEKTNLTKLMSGMIEAKIVLR